MESIGQTEQIKQIEQMEQKDQAAEQVKRKSIWKNWAGLGNSTLKLIALVTMLIDHIAAAILVRFFLAGQYRQYIPVYEVMRGIGRIAFPIYCYMLVEGLKYTRNRWKYLARMGAFALVSEIPFDLAFQSQVLEFGYQNVFFTLFFGLLALILTELADSKGVVWFQGASPELCAGMIKLMELGAALVGLAGAYLFRTDYDWMGVMCILIFYHARGNKWLQLVLGYIAFGFFLGEWVALPAFLLLALYKGKKGFSCKALFYGFYPIHLLFIYLACVLLYIAQYSAL